MQAGIPFRKWTLQWTRVMRKREGIITFAMTGSVFCAAEEEEEE